MPSAGHSLQCKSWEFDVKSKEYNIPLYLLFITCLQEKVHRCCEQKPCNGHSSNILGLMLTMFNPLKPKEWSALNSPHNIRIQSQINVSRMKGQINKNWLSSLPTNVYNCYHKRKYGHQSREFCIFIPSFFQ